VLAGWKKMMTSERDTNSWLMGWTRMDDTIVVVVVVG